MKTTKGGKVMNPTDAYRKELRKKELKRNKKERKKVREVGILKKDPEQLRKQIENLEMMRADGALDKARKHKKRQLQDTLNLVLKKRREYEEKMQEKGETSVMFSHLGPPRRRTTAEEEEDKVKHPKPEDCVCYHPTLNPTGAPPPGKPPMFKSSIGPRIPLSGASSSNAASPSKTESEDVLAVPPPPPPPPPPQLLPDTTSVSSADGSVLLVSLPLPPPPPMPPKPATANLPTPLPPHPLPQPPPGPPPKEQVANCPTAPPPQPLQQSQPPPPGTSGGEERNQSALLNDLSSKDSGQVPLPPPPQSGMPPKFHASQSDGASVTVENKYSLASQEVPKIVRGPPPPRQQTPVPGPTIISNLQPDVLPPGISRFPPLPLDMRPPLPTPGLPGQAPPPGMTVPLIPRPPYGPPPGPHLMMRPPLPPGPPSNFQGEDNAASRPPPPQKPSYVKSAASTVVKKPLAQHTPELTAMVPASVRVRRENVIPKPKPKQSLSTSTAAPVTSGPTSVKPESVSSSSAPKAQSIDDSYMAFLDDMKALGALDG